MDLLLLRMLILPKFGIWVHYGHNTPDSVIPGRKSRLQYPGNPDSGTGIRDFVAFPEKVATMHTSRIQVPGIRGYCGRSVRLYSKALKCLLLRVLPQRSSQTKASQMPKLRFLHVQIMSATADE